MTEQEIFDTAMRGVKEGMASAIDPLLKSMNDHAERRMAEKIQAHCDKDPNPHIRCGSVLHLMSFKEWLVKLVLGAVILALLGTFLYLKITG